MLCRAVRAVLSLLVVRAGIRARKSDHEGAENKLSPSVCSARAMRPCSTWRSPLEAVRRSFHWEGGSHDNRPAPLASPNASETAGSIGGGTPEAAATAAAADRGVGKDDRGDTGAQSQLSTILAVPLAACSVP